MAKTAKEKTRPIWHIDRDNLDAECVLLPKQMATYAEQVPDAKEELDKAESAFKLTIADIDAEIRADPESFGLEKVTEAAIKTTIPGTAGYKKAEKKVREARKHLDTLYVALDILKSKKFAIESLVSLHGMNYFAAPSTRIKHAKGD